MAEYKVFTYAEYVSLGVAAPWTGPFALENRAARDLGGGGKYYSSRGRRPLGGCVHVTAGITDLDGQDSSAEATTNYGRTTTNDASWTFILDSDSIINSLHPDRVGWVQGVSGYNFNRPIVGGEIGLRTTDWTALPEWWVEATLDNLAAAFAPYVVTYDWPLQLLTDRDEIQAYIDRDEPFGFTEHWNLTPETRSDAGRMGGRTTFPWERFFSKLAARVAELTGSEPPYIIPEAAMSLPRNDGTPAAIARLEQAIRAQTLPVTKGWKVTCGPSMAGRTCIRGRHGHLWVVKDGRVVNWSTHYVDAQGGIAGPHVGGALDLSKDDPATGATISTYEKAHGDDLVRVLDSLGYGCIWGVEAHFDHPHIDYRRANRNIVWQGPNDGFTVPEITSVQADLHYLGYYFGPLDGLKETNSERAIKSFQRDHKLEVDGQPGAGQTQPAIRAARKAVASDVWPKGYIADVQAGLVKLGFKGGDGKTLAVDDSPGPNTRFAVLAFQRKHGLTPDGRPGQGTMTKLRSLLPKPPTKEEPPVVKPPVVDPPKDEPPVVEPPVAEVELPDLDALADAVAERLTITITRSQK